VSGDKPEIVSVTGGAGGSDATYDDIVGLAGLFETAGDELRSNAWDDKGLLANGDLLQSAILSPKTFAEAEAAVIAATIGPRGVASRALGIEADALIMTTSVGAYRLADDVVHGLHEGLSYLGGYALGLAAPALVVLGGLGAASLLSNSLMMAYVAAHPELKDQILADVQGFIEDHPELVQELVNSGGGLLDGLVDGPLLPVPYGLRGPLLAMLGIDPVHGTTGDAAGDLAGLFGDTGHEVTANGTDVRHLPPPGSLEDLMAGLSSTNKGGDGEIDIQVVGNPPHYIVNLPGTDSWGDDPGDARDLTANLQLVGGQDTAYSRGIMEAMERAGIPKDAPVMLVGHSQGGMTAAHLAADPEFRERFNVRHVVTAGAPTAQVPAIPTGTQVLSLENTGDVVPLLDGEDNPDAANRTTVRFDGTTGSVGGNHDMGVYTRAGAVVDGYDDPSTEAAIQWMRDDGFFGDGRGPTSTSTYTITRKP